MYLFDSSRRLALAAAACSALLAIGVGAATAAPPTDDQGFVDSTARCTTPDVAVVFGNTAASRVAICKTSSGTLEYRGVRMKDGAKLIVPASQSGNGGYVAENDGITYEVTSSSLVIKTGNGVIREEPMVFFHGPAATQTTSTPSTTTTTTPTSTTATSTTPLPPPLPAEVGGGSR